MLERLLEASLRNRFLVLVAWGVVIVAGIDALRRLPIDAVPDVTPNQVQVLTDAPGLGPVEVEKFITFPVEMAMAGLPGVTRVRSVSRFGLSAVSVHFEEAMDIYFCRRLVMERLPEAREGIPDGLGVPEMGPITTGLGEIYQFEVKGEGRSLMDLRSILDWQIAPKLRSVPGVVEVTAHGGELKTYEVELDPAKLVSYALPIGDVFTAIAENNANTGGATIEHGGEQVLIRGEGLVSSLEDLGNIVVASRDGGTPLYVRDLGRVRFAPMVRQGAATRDGRGEVVTGVVMMLMGENSRVVARRIGEAIREIEKTLPSGVGIETYYDRSDLVRRTIRTVTTNLTEGALLVIAVLLFLLGSLRGGLIVAAAIPLSMLVAFTGMLAAGVSGNLMSLGAIDFGLIVDGSVVMIENIVRHLSRWRERAGGESGPDAETTRAIVHEAGREVLRPVFFAVSIIIIVYLPVLTLQGVEGKMFRPMALTVIFALAGSLALAFTLMPVLASFFLRGVREEETWLVRQTKRLYRPALERTMRHPVRTALVAAAIFAVSAGVATRLGGEFIPRLDEGAIVIHAQRLPGVSVEESIRNTTRIERVLKRFPEVRTVVSKTGRPEIAMDPMGVDLSDVYVMLEPKDVWRTAKTKTGLVAALEEALERSVPGTHFAFLQPIEMRVQELAAGVRSDVAITIQGEDLAVLERIGNEIVRVVSRIPGAADTRAEPIAGMPYYRIIVDRDAVARYGINVRQVLDTVEAMGGKVVGHVFEGEKRFFTQVRFRAEDRSDLERIPDVPVADPHGRMIPLGQLAELRLETGPAQVSRENLHRRLAVEANVRGRDLGSFVADARRAVENDVKLPPGYWLEWGGQFENLERATARLALVVPLALFLIFVLLYTAFGRAMPALLIYLNVPLAATGGVFALALRGMPFSISSGVGFVALFGIAVLNGVVLMSYVLQMRREGASAADAAFRGAMIRLRPVLMTALVASLGFVPMALSTSAGAEVQRPLATVVIGGLVTSTLLTLLVLPALYARIEERRERAAAPAK